MIGFVGGDASKGYADFCVLDHTGAVLATARRDDCLRGHQAIKMLLAALVAEGKASSFIVGFESSGGVERNWLRSFRETSPVVSQVVQLNPLLVQNHRERKLHRNVTDASSAHTIAEVLRATDFSRATAVTPELEEARRLSQHLDGLIEYCGRLKTELQGTLVNSHPELVQFCRQGFSKWVLSLLRRYPTNSMLAEARLEDLAEIPYVTSTRAAHLLELAKNSVCSSTGSLTGKLVSSLVTKIQRCEEEIQELEESLDGVVAADSDLKILMSLPGIGAKTARGLCLAYADFKRFHSEAAVVAYAGLDPRVHQSGDAEKHTGISRRGNSRIRRMLYYPAVVAIRVDPRMKAFHDRLVGRGKPVRAVIVAVMAKLLRIAYACVLKGQLYDPQYEVNSTEVRDKPPAPVPNSLTAPVSRREAKRRKERAAATHSRGQASLANAQ